MDCPVCKTPMLILEYNQTEIDYCPDCKGIWLDQGELEMLINSDNPAVDLSSLADYSKGKRRCPRCRKKMVKGPFPGTTVEVDVCRRDRGIWLDRGEIEKIAKSENSPEAMNGVQNFLKEIFQNNSGQKED